MFGSGLGTGHGLGLEQEMLSGHVEGQLLKMLVAATHAVAVRASLSTECGQLKEVITRGTDGYLAVYAAGPAAIVAVLGTSELNVAMLHYHARDVVERIGAFSAELGNWSAAASAAASAKASPPAASPPPRSKACVEFVIGRRQVIDTSNALVNRKGQRRRSR